MNECLFCSGKAICADSCGEGIKTLGMMLEIMFGIGNNVESNYAYNGVMLKNGNMMCFDNSAGEYAELSIDIRYCPFCGKELEAEEEQ